MTKIAVFVDGTNNFGRRGNPKNTNVFKMFRCVDPDVEKTYIRGIGTGYNEKEHPLRWVFTKVAKGIDLVFGRGATKRVKRAYLYLARRYKTNDEVYLFGFSRGAFIARTLAGFIDKVGLLFASHALERYVEYAFYLYWVDVEGHRFHAFLRNMRSSAPHAPEGGIPVHFLGQWDTVAAVEQLAYSAGSEQELSEITAREQNQPLPEWIRHCRHALAIHDLRNGFTPLLWTGCIKQKEEEQTLKQAWFVGAHADVGGGYPPDDGAGTMYSDIALQWMLEEARACGLPVADAVDVHAYRSGIAPHRSNVNYSRVEPLRVRRQLLEADRRTPYAEYLHESACARMWEALEPVYREHAEGYAEAWANADEAAMRLHYRHCFSNQQSIPPLSPLQLQTDFEVFLEALAKQETPDPEFTGHILRLVAAFGDDEAWQSLPERVSVTLNGSAYEAWRSASDDLGQSILEGGVDKERQDILLRFYLRLLVAQLPHDSPVKKKMKL
jgi:uncharacterized protein (DUF2235 family)